MGKTTEKKYPDYETEDQAEQQQQQQIKERKKCDESYCYYCQKNKTI